MGLGVNCMLYGTEGGGRGRKFVNMKGIMKFLLKRDLGSFCAFILYNPF